MFKQIRLRLLKLLVKTVGMLSTGIGLSYKYGFTSGKMLDYIYLNQPSGRLIIGKWLDRIYLSHRGWEAIRIRKALLEKHLETAIADKLQQQQAVVILDVASGPARYILDTVKRFPGAKIKVIARDLDQRWLEEAKRTAREYGLTDFEYETGDAFDEASFSKLPVKPDIIISSGFYDWIVDDRLVKKSLQLIARYLATNGYFVYTNQSGHIDLKMVQEIFVDFNKDSLQMTVRSPGLINGWVEAEGLKIIKTTADPWGYYSVTLAKKGH